MPGGPIIQSVGPQATWAFYVASVAAEGGIVAYPSAALVASAFLAQPCVHFGEIGRATYQRHSNEMNLCIGRIAAILGPWFGVLALNLHSATSICVAASFLIPLCCVNTWDAEAGKTGSSLPSGTVDASGRFILLWHFFLAFGFYSFNMLLAALLFDLNAPPWMFAVIGSLSSVGELLGARVSAILRVHEGRASHQSRLTSVSFAVVAISRLSCFLTFYSARGSGDSGDILIMISSLLISIVAATLLGDLHNIAANAHGEDLLQWGKAVDALAGIAAPLYVRGVATSHSLGVVMAGIVTFYICLVVFVRRGLEMLDSKKES